MEQNKEIGLERKKKLNLYSTLSMSLAILAIISVTAGMGGAFFLGIVGGIFSLYIFTPLSLIFGLCAAVQGARSLIQGRGYGYLGMVSLLISTSLIGYIFFYHRITA